MRTTSSPLQGDRDSHNGWTRFRGSGHEAAPLAACLAEALGRHLRLEEACLVCFLRGCSPPERALRKSYLRCFTRLHRWLERVASGSDDPWVVADTVAGLLARRSAGIPQARSARTRLRENKERPGRLNDVLANALSVALGAGGQLHKETLLAFGMEGLLAPLDPSGTPLASTDDLKLGWLGLPALAEAATVTAEGELTEARDAFASLLEVASQFASIFARTRGLRFDLLLQLRTDELTTALFGVPAALLIRRRLGTELFDHNLQLLSRELPRLRAMSRLLDALPADLHRYTALDATAVLALPRPEQERLRLELEHYFATHPDDHALLTGTNHLAPDPTAEPS
jgi:hypothetical protein